MQTQFKELDLYLRDQPNIQMLVSHLFPGISPDDIAAVEADLGYALAQDVTAFFQAHNGLLMRWIDKTQERYDPSLHDSEADVEDAWSAVCEVDDYNPQFCTGQFLISGFKALFSSDLMSLEQEDDPMEFRFAHDESFWEDDSWEEPYSFRGIDYDNKGDFIKRLRYLDIFSRDDVVMMLLEPGNPDPPVFHMLSTSTEPDPDSFMPLSDYLSLVPYTLGKPQKHYDMFVNPGEFLVMNKIFFKEE